MKTIFKKSVEMNMKIEKFLDVISDSLLLFEKAITYYLSEEIETFNRTMERICALESEADSLEIEIKVSLYKYMLLPDTRADVLSLVKSLDNIIDATEEITKDFYIQKPKYPKELHKEILEITNSSIKSAEALLLSTRAFFNEVHQVSSYINNVRFYEHEADILQDKIGAKIFNGGLINDLAEKMQLDNFIGKIARISDEAEIIGDKLTIFTIKREI